MKKEILIFVGFVFLVLFIPSNNVQANVPAPEVHYTIYNTYDMHLEIIASSKQESVTSWWINATSYCIGCEGNPAYIPRTINGSLFYYIDRVMIKNNGTSNLTNISIRKENQLLQTIAVLLPNASFTLNESYLYDSYVHLQIITDEGAYLDIMLVRPTGIGGGAYFWFSPTVISLIVVACILFCLSGISLFLYYKKHSKRYILLAFALIVIAILVLLIAYYTGLMMIAVTK